MDSKVRMKNHLSLSLSLTHTHTHTLPLSSEQPISSPENISFYFRKIKQNTLETENENENAKITLPLSSEQPISSLENVFS